MNLIEMQEHEISQLKNEIAKLNNHNESLQATNYREYQFSRRLDKELKLLKLNIELFGSHKKCKFLNAEYDPHGCIPHCYNKNNNYCKGKCEYYTEED